MLDVSKQQAVLEIQERTNARYTATLRDEDGEAIPAASVESITLTLIALPGGGVVNSRNAQNALNANNCTLHATSGLFTWNIQPADTAIVGNTRINEYENHLATISVVWDGGARQQHKELLLKVLNLRSVPQGG